MDLQEPGGRVRVWSGDATLFASTPNPHSSGAERALTGLGGRSRPRPGDSIPGPTMPPTSSGGMIWAAGPGRGVRVVRGRGGR